MKKVIKVIGIILIILILIGIITAAILIGKYNNNLEAVNAGMANGEIIEVEIPSGYGVSGIANLLEEKNVIKDAFSMKIYAKLNNITNLQAGLYEFDNAKEDVETILNRIQKGDVKDISIKMTFIEGKCIKDYVKVIAENTNNTEEEVLALFEDEEYLDYLIEKYWFITEDVKNEDIYYSLEGYLLPDTYTFKSEDITAKEIIESILDYTDKFLSDYKDDIENSEFSIHEILTLASVVEQEGKTAESRSEIAGVFINRLDAGMNLGSDVTTYYAFQINMAEQDLTQKQLDTKNPYNTRHSSMAGKLPVGPICNSSKSSLDAALSPKETDAFYFVADKNGQVYFTKNYSEHTKIIKELKANDLWYVYE